MPRLDAMLARAALSEPRRDAVIFRDTTWSYAEVYDRACRLASALAALGVKKGDRVAFWAANRPEFVEVLFGVPILGAIASPLDHWWTWKDAYAAIEQIRPKVTHRRGIAVRGDHGLPRSNGGSRNPTCTLP